jgi:hypothetical protein
MSVSVRIIKETLTDNSKVFDVVAVMDGAPLRFNCYDKKAAERFADTLAELINECTTEQASRF